MSTQVATAAPAKGPRAARPRWLRWSLRLGRLALTAYLVWLVAAYFLQDRMIFQARWAGPPRVLPFSEVREVLKRDLSPEGDAGFVEAWYMPHYLAGASRPAPLVVLFHGNAELIDHQQGLAEHYWAMGYSVLLPEYRGYGRSGGSPSEAALVGDALHFVSELARRPEVDARRIIFHGRSLGAGVAARVAGRHPPAGLILESSFTNTASLAWRFGVPSFLIHNSFHVDDVVAAARFPLLIIHGGKDKHVPVSHGRALHRLAPAGTEYLELPEATHNNLPGRDHEEAYWSRIDAFLRRHDLVMPAAPVGLPPASQPASQAAGQD